MPKDIPREAVKSSNIAEIGHCQDTERMVVVFSSGARYVYNDVPKDLYELVKGAQSIGKAHHEHIKKGKKEFKGF